ncbi:hypothetical protein SeLEV6574_g07845 [Synchytrium endobioticum]|uniref:Uncharacterized protein n=1 Tax=Synchytrium endobioticum TaxID=286115 RepID=A0A507CE04_9FUNG|nr:hypothetical protein SeLEV6574_g07845 [Synchytrium endobioticum]
MHMPLVSNQDGHLRSEQSRLILKMILVTWLPSNLAMGIAHDDIEVKCLGIHVHEFLMVCFVSLSSSLIHHSRVDSGMEASDTA